jgi:ribose transport system permease protein
VSQTATTADESAAGDQQRKQSTSESRPRPLIRRSQFTALGSNYGAVLVLAAMIIVFSILLPTTFASRGNFSAILADQSIPGILALAAVLALAAGEFDLSLGSNLGFSAIIAIFMSNAGLPIGVVLAVTLATGILIGAANAFLVIRIGVNAFIATLGVGTVLVGGNLWITNSALITLDSTDLAGLTITRVAGIQIVLVYFVLAALIAWYTMEKTPFGRYLRATGMGRDAAHLSGVRTDRYLTAAFVAAGALASLAGFLFASRAGSATPTLGPEFLLPAYAAAFLGATTIKPGYFNVWGTVVGVFILAVGSNGLVILGAETWVTNIFNGLALIVAVSASVIVQKRKANARR